MGRRRRQSEEKKGPRLKPHSLRALIPPAKAGGSLPGAKAPRNLGGIYGTAEAVPLRFGGEAHEGGGRLGFRRSGGRNVFWDWGWVPYAASNSSRSLKHAMRMPR